MPPQSSKAAECTGTSIGFYDDGSGPGVRDDVGSVSDGGDDRRLGGLGLLGHSGRDGGLGAGHGANEDEIIEKHVVLIHNHDEDTTLNRQEVNNSLKRKVSEDNIVDKPSKFILTEIKNFNNENSLNTIDLNYIRRNVYNARKSILLPLPKSIEEVHDTLNTVLSIIVQNIFCSYSLFMVLRIKIRYIPLVFALLPDNNSHTYSTLFLKTIEICLQNNLRFQPVTVVVDFEIAIHNAIKNIWPTVQIHGCNFHLCQNWYRKIQQLGLTNDYNNGKSEIGKFLVHTFGLPLLQDVNDIEDCFVFDLLENMPSDDKVQQYCDYLSENYIFSFSLFPPKLWSSNDTTNACESFHSRFNSSFYHHHPNLHLFVKVLKDIQTETYIKIRSSHTTQRRQAKTIFK
ncbi:uncharacterized protein LOC132935179 [Metopolophium dirhodum]|uniref:uncharacterized protein LOC132935179 n=1 Tax=Metopolophium dirhodum TaxID=44670 RepID=UPI0029905F2B|nr:uncharacterized protein LOC132935179 [Metopolophium dirhodum]